MCVDNCTLAIARIMGGNLYPNVLGTVYFNDVPGGTNVISIIWGLPLYKPATDTSQSIGPHGFHIHENGICKITNSDNPFESAGGHYNPTNQPHGNHVGDFPVIFSNQGYSRMEFFTDKFKPYDVVGKSVIIHENPDDFSSQPSGNSGKRIACGIICAVE